MASIEAGDDTRACEHIDFEQQVVCKILRSGGIIGNIRQYVEEHQQQHIFPQLSLDWLGAKFPTFPVQIIAVLFEERPPNWAQMYECFTQTRLFQAYQQACEKAALNDRHGALGVVFNIDGITFVLHNYEPAIRMPGRRFVRQLGNPPVSYAFEEFAKLLACIDKKWATEPTTTTKQKT